MLGVMANFTFAVGRRVFGMKDPEPPAEAEDHGSSDNDTHVVDFSEIKETSAFDDDEKTKVPSASKPNHRKSVFHPDLTPEGPYMPPPPASNRLSRRISSQGGFNRYAREEVVPLSPAGRPNGSRA